MFKSIRIKFIRGIAAAATSDNISCSWRRQWRQCVNEMITINGMLVTLQSSPFSRYGRCSLALVHIW